MARPLTKQEVTRLQTLRKRAQEIAQEIVKIQAGCSHPNRKVTREVVGYNGYGNDYVSYHKCPDCGHGGVVDGYLAG